nr:glycosyltransferase [Candidatus Brocadiia bacterium]
WRVETVAYDGSAFTPVRFAEFLRRLADRCRAAEPPIVHDFFVMPGVSWAVQSYLAWRGIRVSYVKTFVNAPGGGGRGSFEGLLRAGLNNRAVCNSVARRSRAVTFVRDLPIPGLRVLEAPPRFEPAAPLRREGPPRVAYLGHALRKKGVNAMPGIVRRVMAGRPGRVQFAFSFSELCDCRQAVAALRAMPDVRVVGPDDPAAFFAMADVYLLPIADGYAASGSFNTIWEAMSRGCCVVTAKTSHLPEILTPRNSVRVERTDEDSYAQAVIGLIDNPGKLEELRLSAAQDYAVWHARVQPVVAGRLRDLYESSRS